MNYIYLIHAGTGCTCCSSENHHRGPYRTREDAERRIAYYNAPESKFWPLASQYARRGRYSIVEKNIEPISANRFILDERYVLYGLDFIEVKEDGAVEDDQAEQFYEMD
jgi:hypothetical protein